MAEPIDKDKCEKHERCIVSEPFGAWLFTHWCQEQMSNAPAPAKLVEHYSGPYHVHHELVCSKCDGSERVCGYDG